MISATRPVYQYAGRVIRVKDADTYEILIDLGFRVSLTVPVRLHGFNAPEIGTPEGDAVAVVARAALEGQSVIVQSYRDRRSFERWVADVWLDGQHVGIVLGLAPRPD